MSKHLTWYQGMQPWDGHSKYVFRPLKHDNKLNQNEENTDCICCIAGFGLFNGLQFFILRFKVVYCEKHNNNTHFAIFGLTSSVLCFRLYKLTNPGVSFFLSFCFVPRYMCERACTCVNSQNFCNQIAFQGYVPIFTIRETHQGQLISCQQPAL